MNFKEMRDTLKLAEVQNHKIAMLHYLTFKYAKELMKDYPKKICELLGVKENLAIRLR